MTTGNTAPPKLNLCEGRYLRATESIVNSLQSAAFAVTTTVTAACFLWNQTNQQFHLHSKTFSFHFSPISSGRRSSILPPRDRGRAERKQEKLSSFLQKHYYQIAWCKKLLPLPSHYVYLARSQYMEQFSDSATEAAFSTCTDCSGRGTTASPHIAWVTKPSPTSGGKFTASREMGTALLEQVHLGQAQTVFPY